MSRKRIFDPEFWLDEEVAQLSAHARLLYIGLWGICDDNYATLPNRPDWIKAQVFPYESVNTPQLLSELSTTGKIILFEVDKKEYWFIKNFFKYQRVEKPSKPKYPEFSEANIVNTPRLVGEELVNTLAEVKLSKVKLSKEKSKEKINSLSYLNTLTKEELEDLSQTYKASSNQVASKAEDLYNYCQSKGKRYSNYRALLLNALKKDFGKRPKVVETPEITSEDFASFRKLQELRNTVQVIKGMK